MRKDQDEISRAIGARLRRGRQAKGLTLGHLSRQSRLSIAFLSRLERGQTTTTLANLIRLCRLLDIALGEIFQDRYPPKAPFSLFRRRDEHKRERIAATGYNYLRLAGDLAGQRLDAFELEFPPGASRPMLLVSHEGEEVLYLLSGRIEFQIGRERFVMEPGDCVHFNSDQPHMGRNIGPVPARLLMIVSPSTADRGGLAWCNARAPSAAARGRKRRRGRST